MNILLVNVPYTLVKIELCPLEQVSLDTLRLISLLEAQHHEVNFINMRSKDKYLWKKRKGGLLSTSELQMLIASKTQLFLINNLKELGNKIHQIWLVCNFSFSPYTYDIDIIKSLVSISKKYLADAKIKVGGTFINLFPEFLNGLDIDKFYFDNHEISKYKPKLSVLKDEGYGLFQLTK